MRPRTTVVLVAAWLVFLWMMFMFYQYRDAGEYHPGPQYLLALAAVAAVSVVGAGVGSAITGREPHSASDLVPQTAVGLAVFGVAGLLLAGIGLIRPVVLWTLVAVCGALTHRHIRQALRLLSAIRPPRDGKPVWTAFLAVAILAATACIIGVLAPLTANDAIVYHLTIPKIYAAQGELLPLPYNAYANMPHYGEVLYTVFLSLAGEAGAKMFYFFTLVAAACATYTLAARFVDKRLALAAGSLFLAQPLMIDPRTVCNVDAMLAYFYLSAAILLFDGMKKRSGLAAGLLAGFMLGMKYTAVVPAAVLLAIPALTKSGNWKRIVLAIAIALVVFAPWAVKNESYVGNPVYPMMEETFDGLHWDQVQTSQLITWQRSMGMGRDALDYLLLPLRIGIMGKPGSNYTRFDGILNPVFLILVPLAIIGRDRRKTAIMVMAAAGFVFWALTSQQLRFLIPTLGLAAVLAAVGLRNLEAGVGKRGFRVVLILLVLIQVSGFLVPDQYGRPVISGICDRLPAAAGLEGRGDFLGRSIQSYTLFDQMNQNLPPGEPVFLIWENRGYYLDRPYFADSFFEASTLMRMVAGSKSPAGFRQKITAMGFRYVVVNELLGEFFSRAYPERDTKLLEEFIAEHLTPVHSANRLTLYTIND